MYLPTNKTISAATQALTAANQNLGSPITLQPHEVQQALHYLVVNISLLSAMLSFSVLVVAVGICAGIFNGILELWKDRGQQRRGQGLRKG